MGKGLASWIPARLRTIQHQEFLRIERDQRALWWGKTRGVKAPLADVANCVGAPIVTAAIRGDDHVVKHSPQLIAIDPQQHLGLRQAFFDIEMVAVECDTAIAVGGPWKERPRKLPAQLFGTISR